MRYESGSAVLPNAFSALLMNSKNSASEPSSPSPRHWFWEYFSSASSAVRGLKDNSLGEARNPRDDDDPLQWVSANWEDVTEKFPSQWIVVEKGVVVAHSETASGLREQIKRLAIECPFITKTGRGPIAWRTAYGRY
jgi:hypothetical protein